jgi:hypothetical protein
MKVVEKFRVCWIEDLNRTERIQHLTLPLSSEFLICFGLEPITKFLEVVGPAEIYGQVKESGCLDVFLEISKTRKNHLVQGPINRVSNVH